VQPDGEDIDVRGFVDAAQEFAQPRLLGGQAVFVDERPFAERRELGVVVVAIERPGL
jgi:hypothetical protein